MFSPYLYDVARTHLKNATVWTFRLLGAVEQYETNVIGGSFNGCCWRYKSLEEANRGHDNICHWIRNPPKSTTDYLYLREPNMIFPEDKYLQELPVPQVILHDKKSSGPTANPIMFRPDGLPVPHEQQKLEQLQRTLEKMENRLNIVGNELELLRREVWLYRHLQDHS